MRLLTLLLAAGIALSGCASDSTGQQSTDPLADTDGDGFPDQLEEKLGSDPSNATDVPDVMVHKDIDFSGTASIIMGTEVIDPVGAVGSGCGFHGDIDTDVLTWTIEAPANSTAAHIVDLVVTATLPATMVELDIFVFGPDGAALTGATTAQTPPIKTDTVMVEGKQPVGEYRIEIRGCEGTGDVEVEATAVLGYVPSVEELLHAQGVEHQH